MGGLSRLAHVLETNHEHAEDDADKLATELEAAYALHNEVMVEYRHHAASKKKEGEEALAALRKISNLPPPPTKKPVASTGSSLNSNDATAKQGS